jgi:hypothetical protein
VRLTQRQLAAVLALARRRPPPPTPPLCAAPTTRGRRAWARPAPHNAVSAHAAGGSGGARVHRCHAVQGATTTRAPHARSLTTPPCCRAAAASCVCVCVCVCVCPAPASTRCAVTPPGFMTAHGSTVPCPPGSFREGWAPPGAAGACVSCGQGVFGAASDSLLVFDAATEAATQLPVAADEGACCEYACALFRHAHSYPAHG